MNRITNLFNNEAFKGKDVHMLEAKIPTNLDEMDTFLNGLVECLSDAVFSDGVPLAPVVCGILSEGGGVVNVLLEAAHHMKEPPGKVALAAFAAIGQKFWNAEHKHMKEVLMKHDMEIPTEDWMNNKENRVHFTFQYYAMSMEKIVCDCPACIAFWSAKRSVQKIDVKAIMNDELSVVCQNTVERCGEGCITKLVPGANSGEWIDLPESQ